MSIGDARSCGDGQQRPARASALETSGGEELRPAADGGVSARARSGTVGRRTLAAALLLAAASGATYAGSLGGPFVFDDRHAIVENSTLRPLDFRRALSPPTETPVAGRPVANLSFALTEAAFGPSPAAFRAVNLALHYACALLVFGVVLRVSRLPRFPAEARPAGLACAGITALLFAVHPFGSEVILYATQRTEVLAAAFYLAAVHLLLSAARRSAVGRPLLLIVAGVGTLGAASKEVFVTAPVVAALFDRAFLAGSLPEALRQRRSYYLALIAGIALGLAAVFAAGDPRPGSVRLVELDYLVAQARIVPGYLGHALWPAHPVLDYGPLWAEPGPALAPLLLSAAAICACALAAWKHPRLGFLGVWVLVILAPTSSVLSIHTEVGAERRFYLPLAGCLAYLVVGGAWMVARLARNHARHAALLRRFAVAAACACALGLAARTHAHAASYASTRAFWEEAVRGRPQNARAHYNLAETYRREGDVGRALASLHAALRLQPEYAAAHATLSGLLLGRGELDAGLHHGTRAVTIEPGNATAQFNLGVALALTGQTERALAAFETVLRLRPDDERARGKLIQAYMQLERHRDAERHLRLWLARAPQHPFARALERELERRRNPRPGSPAP